VRHLNNRLWEDQEQFSFLSSMTPSNDTHIKIALKECSEAIPPLLRAVHSAADVFPPLKSAVGLCLVIGETIVVR